MFDRAEFTFFSERVYVEVNPPETNMPVVAFAINLDYWNLN